MVKSNIKAVPLKSLVEELFSPKDIDNTDSTSMLEVVGDIAVRAIIFEMEDRTKATFKYLSISGSEYSYLHCPENIKEAMKGKMVTNDLAESLFAGVTTQIQTYGRIDLCSAAAVSDIARNGFLLRPKTTKEIKEGRIGLFHTLPEELKLTAIMVSMEDAPATRDYNNVALSLQRQRRREKEKLQEEKGMKDVSNEYIEALMFCQLWDSGAACKTIPDVTRRLKFLRYKKEKLQMLKDNIQIRVLGMGWSQLKT